MTATAYGRLRADVLTRMDNERLDPQTDPERVRALVAATVREYQRSAETGSTPRLRDATEMASRLVAAITAFGPLTDILSRPEVEEVFIEGPRVTYLDRTGRLHGLDAPTTEEENRAVVARLLAPTTRTLDTRSPLVQARILDGKARLSAAIPPVAEQLSATIRRHSSRRHTMDSLVDAGSLSAEAAELLKLVMRGWSSVLVSGQPGAGKTSLLTALLGAAPAGRCVRVCEEIRELTVPLTHGSYYETRAPSPSGESAITMRDLLKFCLGMRCELLVVGEVRGAEAFELTRAVNAGCGFACTVHANSGQDALEAITNAAIMAGEHVPETMVRKIFASSIDLVVHVDLHDRSDGGARREVREIVAVMPNVGDVFATEPIFTRPDGPGTPLQWTGVVPPGIDRFERLLPAGRRLRDVLSGHLMTDTAVLS
ncbi:CpaF family protein [Euzebya tangerina]|uniref:CpaF family protein n=1 Tax=Euzebya tangerina TaxID=591198 RepID=UPI000E30C52C|nr:ATPase, T2SS/T4P/T4SS family [Euzebya tangerina]